MSGRAFRTEQYRAVAPNGPLPIGYAMSQNSERLLYRGASDDSGVYGISGVTTFNGVPGPAHVFVLNRANLRVVADRRSDPQGRYEFNNLAARPFTVMALDDNAQDNAVVADRVIPGTRDTTPNPFSFTDVPDADPDAAYFSEFIAVTGITAPVPISITGHATGFYQRPGGPLTKSPDTVSNGDLIRLRLKASIADEVRSVTLNIGGIEATWTVTVYTDTEPDAFSFVDEPSAAPDATVFSNFITVSGVNRPTPISITGHATAFFQRVGGGLENAPSTVEDGELIRIRIKAGTTGETRQATLNIGGVEDTWLVTDTGSP